MARSHFVGQTLDDVMHDVIEEISTRGDRIYPSKGEADEIDGVLLEISNPRARISRTETRGKIFSALGELCWYLAKSNKLAFIKYYIPPYADSADGGEIFGGYGPRLFAWHGVNQVENVIGILSRKSASRQAVIQLFDANDIVGEHKDVPCTCTLQFMNRHERLNLIVNMRSNDVHWGLPHDVFCFTMLQEIVARSLSIEVGHYKHAVGSLHLYTRHKGLSKRFLKEGWQPTKAVMPAMPSGDPWSAIRSLVEAESTIRIRGALNGLNLATVDPYWADLIRLLQVFGARARGELGTIEALRGMMASDIYFPFIDRLIEQLRAQKEAG